jgi:hypothetical protein
MRRPLPIAAFALCLALPLWAQHGGGHGGGGHAGGFGGHAGFSGGHIGGGHVSSGMHVGRSASRGFTNAPSSQHSFHHQPFWNNGHHGHRFYNYGFRNNCYGYSCRYGSYYPYAYSGFYDPYWWGDSGSSYDQDYDRDRAIANEMNAQNLDEQRMRSQEDQDYRDEYGNDRDHYARSAPPPREPESLLPDTVLVFRDQHKLEVQNYAIVGQTLWTFGPQHNQKIPLSALDLTATTKANDDRGLTFRVPASGEAQ